MKHLLRLITTGTASLAILLAGVGTAHATANNSALSLVAASGNFAVGSNFSVVIHENSGAVSVNAVEADLSYDATKLQYIGVDNSGSGLPLVAHDTIASGIVEFARGTSTGSPAVTGDQIVATVTFKAIASSVGTNVAFADTSAIVRDSDAGNDWDGVTTGGSYSLSSPIYRLANYITHERLFTVDPNEKNSITGHNGWVYENVAFQAIDAATPSAQPVYRLANYITHERLFTTDLNEKNSINGHNGWVYENIAFRALPTGSVAVYRLANYITHERLFTTDLNEKNSINGHNGWVYENIAFYEN